MGRDQDKVYKCKPGHHHWVPYKTGQLQCLKCGSIKWIEKADPRAEDYAPDAFVWID